MLMSVLGILLLILILLNKNQIQNPQTMSTHPPSKNLNKSQNSEYFEILKPDNILDEDY